MIKAIIFDFDGVIGDTYQNNFELFKPFIQNISEQDFKDNHNGNIFEGKKITLTPEQWEKYFANQKKLFTKTNLFPLKRVLARLSKNFQLFIISSTPDASIKYFLKYGALNRFFEKIFGATTCTSKFKKFQMIFEQYGLGPEECLFVTDTLGDILEAKKVKMRTIAVAWGYHEKELLARGNPLAIVCSGKELLESIKKYSG
ncbi:MAG: HAD family hydrolase [Patescibacteria group bacterium]|nr:HAD family hydrolase [Patescibacteria group bacterium]